MSTFSDLPSHKDQEDGAQMCPPPPTSCCRRRAGGDPRRKGHTTRAERSAGFKKTKMCKFFLQGACSRGTRCCFAHGEEEISTVALPLSAKMCKTLIATGRCRNPECKYAHSKDEIMALNDTTEGSEQAALPLLQVAGATSEDVPEQNPVHPKESEFSEAAPVEVPVSEPAPLQPVQQSAVQLVANVSGRCLGMLNTLSGYAPCSMPASLAGLACPMRAGRSPPPVLPHSPTSKEHMENSGADAKESTEFPAGFNRVMLPMLAFRSEPRVVVKNTFIEVVDISPSPGSARRCSSTPARAEDRDQCDATIFEFPWGLVSADVPPCSKRVSGQRTRSRSPDNFPTGTLSTIANKFGQALSCRRRSQSRTGSKSKKSDEEGPLVFGVPIPHSHGGSSDVLKAASVESSVTGRKFSQSKAERSHTSVFAEDVLRDCGPTLLASATSTSEIQRKFSFNTDSTRPSHLPAVALGRMSKRDDLQGKGASSFPKKCLSGSSQMKRPSSCRGPTLSSSTNLLEQKAACIPGCGAAMARRRSSQPTRTTSLLTPCSSPGPPKTRDSLEVMCPKARWRLWQVPSM